MLSKSDTRTQCSTNGIFFICTPFLYRAPFLSIIINFSHATEQIAITLDWHVLFLGNLMTSEKSPQRCWRDGCKQNAITHLTYSESIDLQLFSFLLLFWNFIKCVFVYILIGFEFWFQFWNAKILILIKCVRVRAVWLASARVQAGMQRSVMSVILFIFGHSPKPTKP